MKIRASAGSFQINEKIGGGSFGIVYKCLKTFSIHDTKFARERSQPVNE